MLIISTNLVLRAQRNPLLDKISSYTFRKQELKMVVPPPHYHLQVRDAQNKFFLTVGLVQQPSFPGLQKVLTFTPLDLFFWSYMKSIVYAENIRELFHLQERISAAITTNCYSWYYWTQMAKIWLLIRYMQSNKRGSHWNTKMCFFLHILRLSPLYLSLIVFL